MVERDVMAQIQDIPRLTNEFIDLAKEYLLQETVEPAKKLGRFAGLSLGGALLGAIGVILLSIAGMRTLIDALPEGVYWEALSYILSAFVMAAVIALIVKLVPDRGVHEAPPSDGTTEDQT